MFITSSILTELQRVNSNIDIYRRFDLHCVIYYTPSRAMDPKVVIHSEFNGAPYMQF